MANTLRLRISSVLKELNLAKLITRTDDYKLVDIDGNEYFPTPSVQSSTSDLNLANSLWIKIVTTTEHRLMLGTKVILKFNPIAGDTLTAALLSTLIAALGEAAYLNVGIAANELIQLNGDAKLPAVDGSLLTNLSVPALPIGAIIYVPYATPDTGFAKCNGAALNRVTYVALFTKIGTTFGIGDGSTTFNLPDIRGEFIRSWDDSRGIDTSRVLGSFQDEAFKQHTHTYDKSQTENDVSGGSGITVGADSYTSTVSGSTGGSETRPRNIAMNAIIRII